MSATTKPRGGQNSSQEAANTGTTPSSQGRGLAIFYQGRGRMGKTLHTQWLIETRNAAGNIVIPADGDRGNQTLRNLFPQALKPSSAANERTERWLQETAKFASMKKVTVAFDMGANDSTVAAQSDNLKAAGSAEDYSDLAFLNLGDLTELEGGGLDLTILYFMTGDSEDARQLQKLLAKGLVGPRTILIYNLGSVLGSEYRDVEQALMRGRQEEEVQEALKLGAREVTMPVLDMETADWIRTHKMHLLPAVRGEAPENQPPLDPLKRQAILKWLREMQKSHAQVLAEGLLG